MNVNRLAANVPNGMAKPGLFRSPEILAPAKTDPKQQTNKY